MATQTTVIEVDIQGTAKVESMRTQMRKLREELATLPEGTAEFTRVQKQLGELKDKMDDLGKSVNTMSGEPLERLNNSFGMIGSSILSLDFGAAQTGIQGISSAIKDFKFGDLSKAAKGFGGTMLDLGKSLMMNPIFAIAGILLLIITNFEKLTKAGGLVGKVFGFIGDQIAIVKNAVVDFLNWTGIIDTQAEERAEAQKKRNEEMIADLQKANDAVGKMRDDLARANMSEREKELADIKKWYDEQLWLARGNSDTQAEVTKLAREKQAQINDKYDQQEAEKRKIEADKRAKEEQARREHERAEELKSAEKRIEAKDLNNLKLAQSDLKLNQQITAIVISEEEKRLMAERKANEERMEMWNAVWYAKYDIASQTTDALMALNNALTESGIISAEKGFKIGKALSIAQTTISTIQGVQNALSAQSTIPEPFGTALKIANAVTIGATGAANIAKIAKTQFNQSGASGGGSMSASVGSSGGMGGGSTNAPALDLSFINNQTNQPQPLQTYVLATNVSSAQEAQQKIKDQSKIIK